MLGILYFQERSQSSGNPVNYEFHSHWLSTHSLWLVVAPPSGLVSIPQLGMGALLRVPGHPGPCVSHWPSRAARCRADCGSGKHPFTPQWENWGEFKGRGKVELPLAICLRDWEGKGCVRNLQASPLILSGILTT